MKDIKKLNEITLPSSLSPEEKLNIISDVYDEAKRMMMHFDGLRLRNLNFAIIVFAGLFGLGAKLAGSMNLLFITIPILVFMIVFLRIDRKHHVYSHGFQGSGYELVHKMTKIKSEGDLVFEKYDYEYADKAEWFCLNTIIYIGLMIGGVVSYFILPWVQSSSSTN